jgi:hypothetical protein
MRGFTLISILVLSLVINPVSIANEQNQYQKKNESENKLFALSQNDDEVIFIDDSIIRTMQASIDQTYDYDPTIESGKVSLSTETECNSIEWTLQPYNTLTGISCDRGVA